MLLGIHIEFGFLVHIISFIYLQAANEILGHKAKGKDGIPGDGGVARCTFEDKILMSDIVYLKGWISVDIPKFFNPLTTALQPRDRIWQGMKTVGELRWERNIPVPVNKDSLYKVIEYILLSFLPLALI